MCWSATADLAAGVCVGAIGVVCVARVGRTGAARDLPLAALPLLLGAHQIVESVVWDAGGGAGPATIVWAVIALPLLALWVPLAVLSAAPAGPRRRVLVLPVALGVAVAAVLAHSLATRTVTADIRGHTIGYAVHLPSPALVVAGYLLATVGALLLSGDRTVRLLGVLVAVGAVVCAVIWRLAFVSTWCAFAALASVVVLGWAWRRTPAPRPAA
ncbi:hypothetical protein OG875_00775 [Streptomyces sp. NBC_01498]|uniref:DUF6629 family protein n=1 Tax=Streptomyces sp. NBC_01498 TaxID=2975870 RepID=UPI002E7BBFC6|nr:DUF6629 family protein [Streptomyces sp. NBC_01498]WTL23257.1 hypothetical protein OG875_00775 [Streptomyces sp. NBC_01498]